MAIKLYKIPNESKKLVPRRVDYLCPHLYGRAVLGEKLEAEQESSGIADIGGYGENEDKTSALCWECLQEYDQADRHEGVTYETGKWEPPLDKSLFKNALKK